MVGITNPTALAAGVVVYTLFGVEANTILPIPLISMIILITLIIFPYIRGILRGTFLKVINMIKMIIPSPMTIFAGGPLKRSPAATRHARR